MEYRTNNFITNSIDGHFKKEKRNKKEKVPFSCVKFSLLSKYIFCVQMPTGSNVYI
jgi:hypothetical protein